MGGLRGEMLGEIGGLRGEMNARFDAVNQRLDDGFSTLDRDVQALTRRVFEGE
jgi:hypothetical protein